MSGNNLEAMLSIGAVRYGDNLTEEEINTNTRLDKLENQNAGERLSYLEDANSVNEERITFIEGLNLGERLSYLEDSDHLNTSKIKTLENINADERISILEKNTRRLFKPAFGVCQWWITTDKTTGRYTCVSDERIKADIDIFSAMGIEEMSLCVHCSFDTSNKEWYTIHSGANILMAYNYCISKGIRPNSLKFMVYGVTKVDTLGQYFTSFKEFITSKVNSFCSFFSSKGCELDAVTVLNELPNLYNKTENKDFVLSLLQIPKNYNYKASISMTSVWEYSSLSSDIINALDVFCFNCYPTISYNGEQASLEEAIQAWDKLICGYKSIKQRHSDKEIIITETGCQDRYEALINPAAYNWTTDYPNTSNGKAPALFLKCLFESEMKDLVKSINYWFFDALYDSNGVIYKDVDKVIREYIKGVDD